MSISVGVRGTEKLTTTQASDVRPEHGTKAPNMGNNVRGRENEKRFHTCIHQFPCILARLVVFWHI